MWTRTATEVWSLWHFHAFSLSELINVCLPKGKKKKNLKGKHSPDFIHFLSPTNLLLPFFYINVTILDFNLNILLSKVMELSQQQKWLKLLMLLVLCCCCLPCLKWACFHLLKEFFLLEMLKWLCGVGKTN